MHRLLRPFGAEGDEAVNVVQRVEKEVGVELALEVLQFGLGTALLQLVARRLHGVPATGHAEGDREARHQHVDDGVDEEEADDFLQLPLVVRPRAHRLGCGQDVHQQVDADDGGGDEHEVGGEESPRVLAEKEAVDEQAVVDVEHDHERERHQYGADVSQEAQHLLLPPGEEEGRAEQDDPCADVDGIAHLPVAEFCCCSYLVHFHWLFMWIQRYVICG